MAYPVVVGMVIELDSHILSLVHPHAVSSHQYIMCDDISSLPMFGKVWIDAV